MTETDFGRLITKRSTSVGTVYICDLVSSMWVVIAFSPDNRLLLSRSFSYTDKTKKKAFASCRSFYKKVKDLMYKRDILGLEDLI